MNRKVLKYSLIGVLVIAASQLICGCHAGGGPVIGYALNRGLMLGWEAGGGAGPAHFNLGGSYRKAETRRKTDEAENDAESVKSDTAADKDSESDSGIEAVHYLVFEPPFPMSATLGAGVSTQNGFGFVGGIWFGWAEIDPWRDWGSELDCDYDRPDYRVFFSAALGLRYNVGAWEIYLTPKAGFVRCIEIAS